MTVRSKTSLQANSQFGRYEIRSLLGVGGMGEVYLAFDTSLRRKVAIKVLPAAFTENKTRLSRFEREAYAAYRRFTAVPRRGHDNARPYHQ